MPKSKIQKTAYCTLEECQIIMKAQEPHTPDEKHTSIKDLLMMGAYMRIGVDIKTDT